MAWLKDLQSSRILSISYLLITVLRRFGKDIKDDLIIAASLLSGILLGYLVLSAFSGM